MIFKRTPPAPVAAFFAALTLGALILGSARPLAAQVVPSAESGGLPLFVGAGVSRFNTDCGPYFYSATCYLNGITVWADWNLTRLPGPPLLHGLGIALEGRDLNFGGPTFLSNSAEQDTGSNQRMDTAVGGIIYHWRHYRRIRPYGKAMAGIGSIDFPPLPDSPPTYRHDNRTITVFGGGADVHVWRAAWLRADYEYQLWPNLFGLPNSLTPYGVTVGAVVDVSRVFPKLHNR